MPPLSPEARTADLPALGETGWEAVPDRDAIRKVWRFKDFSAAWAFMTRVALEAERLNHHPEWRNTYNIVDVTLTTHDCAGLSDLDITLARSCDRLAGTARVLPQNGSPILSLCQERAAGRRP